MYEGLSNNRIVASTTLNVPIKEVPSTPEERPERELSEEEVKTLEGIEQMVQLQSLLNSIRSCCQQLMSTNGLSPRAEITMTTEIAQLLESLEKRRGENMEVSPTNGVHSESGVKQAITNFLEGEEGSILRDVAFHDGQYRDNSARQEASTQAENLFQQLQERFPHLSVPGIGANSRLCGYVLGEAYSGNFAGFYKALKSRIVEVGITQNNSSDIAALLPLIFQYMEDAGLDSLDAGLAAHYAAEAPDGIKVAYKIGAYGSDRDITAFLTALPDTHAGRVARQATECALISRDTPLAASVLEKRKGESAFSVDPEWGRGGHESFLAELDGIGWMVKQIRRTPYDTTKRNGEETEEDFQELVDDHACALLQMKDSLHDLVAPTHLLTGSDPDTGYPAIYLVQKKIVPSEVGPGQESRIEQRKEELVRRALAMWRVTQNEDSIVQGLDINKYRRYSGSSKGAMPEIFNPKNIIIGTAAGSDEPDVFLVDVGPVIVTSRQLAPGGEAYQALRNAFPDIDIDALVKECLALWENE